MYAKIKEHYTKEAKEHGLSPESTMPDSGVRELEINILKKYIQKISDGRERIMMVLEVGCGNGYTASQLHRYFKNMSFVCTDTNKDMIKLAKKRKLKNVDFKVLSATNLRLNGKSFDIAYTERCLINLPSWEEQKKVIIGIHKVLKKGGFLLLIENFNSGWMMLNKSRETLGLEPIRQKWHNIALDDTAFDDFIKKYFIFSDFVEGNDNNFLSMYFYGSRVLYPALVINRKEIVYNNAFIQMFKHLLSVLNYSPIQFRLLKKI